MNPYLTMLKSKKDLPHPVPEVTKGASVSFVSEVGSPFPEIDTPSVSFVSAMGTPVSEITAPSTSEKETWSADEWMAMITELDGLIAEFCRRYFLSPSAHARILMIRARQPLHSIPGTLEWFRRELGTQDPEQGKDRP